MKLDHLFVTVLILTLLFSIAFCGAVPSTLENSSNLDYTQNGSAGINLSDFRNTSGFTRSVIALTESGEVMRLNGSWDNTAGKWNVTKDLVGHTGATFYCDDCGDSGDDMTPVGPGSDYPYDPASDSGIPDDWIDLFPQAGTTTFDPVDPGTWTSWAGYFGPSMTVPSSVTIPVNTPGLAPVIPPRVPSGNPPVISPMSTAGSGGGEIGEKVWNCYCAMGGNMCCEVRRIDDPFMAGAVQSNMLPGAVTFTQAMNKLLDLRADGLGGDCTYGIIRTVRY